jgi:gamma-glutamyltranspeptidase / glutathione hydrolase
MRVSAEGDFPPSTLVDLRGRGHEIVAVDDYDQFGSCCQAIWWLDDGNLGQRSAPRRTAAGL